jgi:transcriptional regulator with XRE-family HTH domain
MEKVVAENIRKLRETWHWTQEELSVASGVDVRTIQRAEAGQKLSLETLKALAAAFDTSIENLQLSEDAMRQFLAEFQARYSVIDMQPCQVGPDLSGRLSGEAYLFQKAGQFSNEQRTKSPSSRRSYTTTERCGTTTGPSRNVRRKGHSTARSRASGPTTSAYRLGRKRFVSESATAGSRYVGRLSTSQSSPVLSR